METEGRRGILHHHEELLTTDILLSNQVLTEKTFLAGMVGKRWGADSQR